MKRSERARALSYMRRRFASARKAELERWVSYLGLEVRGTGADGAVTKTDLEAAIRAELER